MRRRNWLIIVSVLAVATVIFGVDKWSTRPPFTFLAEGELSDVIVYDDGPMAIADVVSIYWVPSTMGATAKGAEAELLGKGYEQMTSSEGSIEWNINERHGRHVIFSIVNKNPLRRILPVRKTSGSVVVIHTFCKPNPFDRASSWLYGLRWHGPRE